MAIDFPLDKGLDERALARYAGGQGAIADSLAGTLLDLLGEEALTGAHLDLGAVVSQTSLDSLLVHQDHAGAPLPATTSVTFEDGKPTVHSLSTDPADGSTRAIVAHLDEAGALLQTEETHTLADGRATITLRVPLGEGSEQTVLTRKAADGEVLETTSTTRQTDAEGMQTIHIVTTRADGSEHREQTQKDADGHLLSSLITDVAADGSARVEEVTAQEDGSRRTLTTEKDAEGHVSMTREVLTAADGSQQLTETDYHAVGRHTEVTLKDAQGQVTGTQVSDTLLTRDASGSQLLDTLVSYRADGTARVRLTVMDEDGTVLSSTEVDTTPGQAGYYGKVQQAVFDMPDGTTHEVRLYFHTRSHEGEPATGKLMQVEAQNVLQDYGRFVPTSAVYYADGTAETYSLIREPGGTTVESSTQHHVDGSTTTDVTTNNFGGNTSREVRHTAADGRLLESGDYLYIPNGDKTDLTTVYHEDGSSHTTLYRRDARWLDVEKTQTMTFADGSQTIESETYPGGGTQTALAHKDANGALLDETITLVRPDESQRVETRTYHADGRYEALLTEKDPDGTVVSTLSTTRQPLESGGTHTRTFETTPDGTVETLTTHDADGAMLQSSRTGTNLAGITSKEFHSRAADGSSSRDTHLMTDAAGNVTLHTERTVTIDADGVRRTEDATYLTNGSTSRTIQLQSSERGIFETSRIETFPLSDGQQRIEATTWQGNYAGIKTESVILQDRDGTILESTTTETRRDGHVITNVMTPQPDGSRRDVMTYSEPFKTTTVTTTTRPDGSQLVHVVATDADDRVLREEVRQVDANGIEQESTVTERSAGLTTTTRTTRGPDGSVHVTRERRDANDALFESVERSTAADGSQTETERHFRDGALTSELVTLTDADGQEVETTSTIVTRDPALGETVQIVTERPDGSSTWVITTTKDDQVTRRETREYEASGASTIQTSSVLSDGSTRETLDRFDSEHALLESSWTTTALDADGIRTVSSSQQVSGGTTHHRETRTAPDGNVLSSTDFLSHPDGSRQDEEMALQADGTIRTVARTYGPGTVLEETTITTIARLPDGSRSLTVHSESPDASWRQEVIHQDAEGEILSRTLTSSRRQTDDAGIETVQTTIDQPDGTRLEITEIRDAALTLLERQVTQLETDDAGVETRRTEVTRPDGTSRDVVTTRHPDGLVIEETVDRIHGSETLKVTIRKQGDDLLDTTRVETSLDANHDRVVETLVTRPDGSSERTHVVTHAPGAQTTTETVTAADGSETVRTTATASDGTRNEQVLRKDADGATLETVTTETATDGTVTRTVTTPQPDGATLSVATHLGAAAEVLETVETLTHADGRVTETRLTPNADGSRREVRTETDADGDWVSTRVTTIAADASRTIETRTPGSDGALQTVLIREDAQGQTLERVESLTTTSESAGLRTTSVLSTYSDGSTRDVRTLTSVVSGKVFETTIIETSTDAEAHSVVRTLTTRTNGTQIEERLVKTSSGDEVSFSRVETYAGGSEYHQTRTHLPDGSLREEEGSKGATGDILSWKVTETEPQGDGSSLVTVHIQNGDRSTRKLVFTRDADGNLTYTVDETATWQHTISTETLADGATRETALYKAEDGETVLESRVTTTAADGSKTIDVLHPVAGIHVVEQVDANGILRARTISRTTSNGGTETVTATYREDQSLQTETSETRSATGTLLYSRTTQGAPDGTAQETWEDHSQAPHAHRIVTRKDAAGDVLETTETEIRILPDGATQTRVRVAAEDGSRHESERLMAADGAELRFESRETDADGTVRQTRRERFSDGSYREYEDISRADGSGRTVVTRRDATGVETVDTRDDTNANDYTRTVVVKNGSGQLLSETWIRRNPVDGLVERTRVVDAEGSTETYLSRHPDGTIVQRSTRELPSGIRVTESETRTLPGGAREVWEIAFDAAGDPRHTEVRSYSAIGVLTQTVVTDVQPDGGKVVVTTTENGGTSSEVRVVTDAENVEIARSSWSRSRVYHVADKTTTTTYTETREDGTVLERRERSYLSGYVFESTETFTDTDGSQIITRTHDRGTAWAAGGSFLSAYWTETVTRKAPDGAILDTTATKTTTQEGGGVRLDRLVTRKDGTSQTDFRILDAQGEVLEFRTVDVTPHAGGGQTRHTVAAFRDGSMLDELIEVQANGRRTITATTHMPSGEVREVVSTLAADDTVLERQETLTRPDGSKVVKTDADSRSFDPLGGMRVEIEQIYDASETLVSETVAKTFANGSRHESSLLVSDGETIRTQAEFEAGGRQVYGFSETTHTNGQRTIVASKTHIDGSTERIETTVDASGKILAYQHTLVDSAGQTHAFDDAHVPKERPALVRVEQRPTARAGHDYFERTIYTYADGSTISEELTYGYWYSYRVNTKLTRHSSSEGLIYEQSWYGSSGMIGNVPQTPNGPRKEVGFGAFTDLTISAAMGTEVVSWRAGQDTHVVLRDAKTHAPIRTGTYTFIGHGEVAFHFVSADGLREISGIKGIQGALADPYSERELRRSTETILDPATGTKVVIECAPGPNGNNQRAVVSYLLQEDGSYVRQSSHVTTTYSDRSTLVVDRTYDDAGAIAHEVHRFQSPNGKLVVETTITHLGGGASDSLTTFTQSGKVIKTETVRTRMSGNTETTETQTYDADGKRTAWTSAVTTGGTVQVLTTYHPTTKAVTSVETSDITTQIQPDGRIEKVYKARGSNTITTLRWGPSGEYAGGSKVHTSADGNLVTTEVFTPEGNKTITLIEKKAGTITGITTSHIDPFGNVSNVSRADNLSLIDPMSAIAADAIMAKLGFTFITQPDGSKKIDFSKRVAGVPFTVDGLDFSKVGIDLNRNPLETMTSAFTEIASGNATPDNYAKLIGSMVLTLKDAKSNPGVMAGYLAFCGIDMALKETPFGQQWLSIKKELNGYLDTGLQGGMFGGVDVMFKFVDDLAGGAASAWLRDNGMGNALDALMHPNALLGTPGEMVANMARTLATGGAYLPVKLLYDMMPDSVQRVLDGVLKEIPGYSEVAHGLNLAAGYIDDGVQTGLRYAHQYAKEGIKYAFTADTYVAAAEAFVSLSELYVKGVTSFGNLVADTMSDVFDSVVDVTKDFANLMSDIASQGIAAASHLANTIYGGLKSIGNAIADGASTAWNETKNAFNKAVGWLGF